MSKKIGKGLIVNIQKYTAATTNELAILCRKNVAAIRTDQNINIDVPIIGLRKNDNYKYYITPTIADIKSIQNWSDYIAIDSRKGNNEIEFLYSFCHLNDKKIVADIEKIEDVKNIINICEKQKIKMPCFFATTFSFFKTGFPNVALIEEIKKITNIKIIAEGHYTQGDQIREAIRMGANNICIGAEISDIEYLSEKFKLLME